MPPTKQNDDELEESSSRASLSWFLWLPLAALIYFLSLGPAIWVYEHNQSAAVRKSLETIYRPLEWAARKPGVGKIIEAYAKWWYELGKQ